MLPGDWRGWSCFARRTSSISRCRNHHHPGSSEPNVLGIKDFDDDYLFVLQYLLKDLSPGETRAALRKEYPARRAGSLEGRLKGIAESLREAKVFRAMLAG